MGPGASAISSLPLRSTATALVDRLGADAALVSRAVGDVLVAVAECSAAAPLRTSGQVVLTSDYPLTEEVLRRVEPRIVTLGEPGADPQEAALLDELGFASLLMLPLVAGDAPWGLVEAYRHEGRRPFLAADVALAEELLLPLARAIEQRETT